MSCFKKANGIGNRKVTSDTKRVKARHSSQARPVELTSVASLKLAEKLAWPQSGPMFIAESFENTVSAP